MSWSAMVLLKSYKQFKVSRESRLLIRKVLEQMTISLYKDETVYMNDNKMERT